MFKKKDYVVLIFGEGYLIGAGITPHQHLADRMSKQEAMRVADQLRGRGIDAFARGVKR